MAIEPFTVLRTAIRQVPSVKYALGVAGVAAGAALIVKSIGFDRAGIILLSGTFVAMVLLYVFSSMVISGARATRVPSLILLYSVIVFFCVFLLFTITAFAFVWPKPWAQFIGITIEPPDPTIRFSTEHGGPVTLQPGETRGFNIELKHSGPVDVIVNSIVSDWTGREKQRKEWMDAGRGNTPEIWFNVCSASQGNSCPDGVQKGINGTFRRDLPVGPATVVFFNFRDSPPITFSTTIKYPD
jgi:hypothetical protein